MIQLKGPEGVRLVEEGRPYRLNSGEKLIGSISGDKNHPLNSVAIETGIGVGDLIAKITESTGFKTWWNKQNGGNCKKCEERQAVLNYLKFQSPSWLKNWVKKD